VKALGGLYLYAMRFIPRSVLFVRLRNIQQNLLLNATGLNDQMVTEGLLKTINTLAEDGEGGGGDFQGQPVSSPAATATTSADIATLPTGIGAKQVIKRKRNPAAVKKLTLKFPDPRNKE